jgi:U5 small nuclear ribonucleoprotein component
VAPPRDLSFYVTEKEVPETPYTHEYLAGLARRPGLVRSIAIVGHFHHGKTLFSDLLLSQTHNKGKWPLTKEVKYTDYRKDEI